MKTTIKNSPYFRLVAVRLNHDSPCGLPIYALDGQELIQRVRSIASSVALNPESFQLNHLADFDQLTAKVTPNRSSRWLSLSDFEKYVEGWKHLEVVRPAVSLATKKV